MRSTLLCMSALTCLRLGTESSAQEAFFEDLFFPSLECLFLQPMEISEHVYSLLRRNRHIRQLEIEGPLNNYSPPVAPLGQFRNLVMYDAPPELMNDLLPGSPVSEIWLDLDKEVSIYTHHLLQCLSGLSLDCIYLKGTPRNIPALSAVLYYASCKRTLVHCAHMIVCEPGNIEQANFRYTIMAVRS